MTTTHVIVVIGAGSIGQAIARRISAGKHVLLADLKQENADAAAKVLRKAEAAAEAARDEADQAREQVDEAQRALTEAEAVAARAGEDLERAETEATEARSALDEAEAALDEAQPSGGS